MNNDRLTRQAHEDEQAVEAHIRIKREDYLNNTAQDWTHKDGRSNSSARYLHCVAEVKSLILDSAFTLLQGHADTVAGLIVAQLAHVHGLEPTADCHENCEGRAIER